MNVLSMADAYKGMSNEDLDTQLQRARQEQARAAEGENEEAFLQADRVIQAILLAKSRQQGEE